MTIKGTEKMKDWGKKIPVNDTSHISQTNKSADDGEGAHVTTNIPGERAKVHDHFDSEGNHQGTTFAKR